MNKENAKDYLPLVQALADGKTIQWLDYENRWADTNALSAEWPAEKYRIKPEPKEIFVVIDKDNDGSHIAFYSEEMAIKDAEGKYEVRHYREVI